MLNSDVIRIDPAGWNRWKNDPVTLEVMRVLQLELEVYADRLLTGNTLVPGQEIRHTAEAVGAVNGLKVLLFDLEDELQQQWKEAEEEKLRAEEEKKGG